MSSAGLRSTVSLRYGTAVVTEGLPALRPRGPGHFQKSRQQLLGFFRVLLQLSILYFPPSLLSKAQIFLLWFHLASMVEHLLLQG